jgi:hypothetical protein
MSIIISDKNGLPSGLRYLRWERGLGAEAQKLSSMKKPKKRAAYPQSVARREAS